MKNNSIKLILYVAVIALLTSLDQITKYFAVLYLKYSSPYVLIDGVLELHYLQNDGAAWGILSGKQGFFIILTIIAMIAFAYIAIKTPATFHYLPVNISVILLISGGLGNFIDRIKLGYVHDFIYFKLIDFPIFNVADSYMTIAAVLFAIVFLFVYGDNDFDYLKPYNRSQAPKL